MCVEALLLSATRHRQVLVHRTRHNANRLVTSGLKLLILAVCMCFESSVCVKGGEAACTLTSIERSPFNGGEPRNAQGNSGKPQKHVVTCTHVHCKHTTWSHLHVTNVWLNYQIGSR